MMNKPAIEIWKPEEEIKRFNTLPPEKRERLIKEKAHEILQPKNNCQLTESEFDQAVGNATWVALDHHREKLTPAQFDHCVAEEPFRALMNWGDELTPGQILKAGQNNPELIITKGLMEKLDDTSRKEVAARCVETFPETLLSRPEYASPEQFEACVKNSPVMAVFHQYNRLGTERINSILKETPYARSLASIITNPASDTLALALFLTEEAPLLGVILPGNVKTAAETYLASKI